MQAFEITIEDLLNVIEQQGRTATQEKALEMFQEIDFDAVTEAAFFYDDTEEQTRSAYEEIEIQLRDNIRQLPKLF